MRRLALLVSLVVVLLVGTFALSRLTPATVAQDATPEAGAITIELLGSGLPSAAPGFDLQLYRITLGAGAVVPDHTHPGAAVVHVESGTLGVTSLQGEARVIRAGTMATPGAEGEVVAPNTDVEVHAGDALFFPDEHGDRAWVVGDEPVVLLLAQLYTEGEPVVTFLATPTP